MILQNLADDLKSEFSGKIEEAIVSLMMLPECYDAVSLHDAMSVSFFFYFSNTGTLQPWLPYKIKRFFLRNGMVFFSVCNVLIANNVCLCLPGFWNR